MIKTNKRLRTSLVRPSNTFVSPSKTKSKTEKNCFILTSFIGFNGFENLYSDEPNPFDEHRHGPTEEGRQTFRNRLLSKQGGVEEKQGVSRLNEEAFLGLSPG